MSLDWRRSFYLTVTPWSSTRVGCWVVANRYSVTAEEDFSPGTSSPKPPSGFELEKKHIGQSNRSGTSVIHDLTRRGLSHRRAGLTSARQDHESSTISDKSLVTRLRPRLRRTCRQGGNLQCIDGGVCCFAFDCGKTIWSLVCVCCGLKGGPSPDWPRKCPIPPMFRDNVLILPDRSNRIQPARDLDHLSEVPVETELHTQASTIKETTRTR